MDAVVAHRNNLMDRIKKATQHTDSHSPLLAQIDDWEDMMIEKVRIVAENTRQQVTQLLNSKWMKISDDFKKFSQELTNLKETENFVEDDLTRLKSMIHEFNYELKHLTKPVMVELHTELSDKILWNQLIYAEERSTHIRTQQRQQQGKGKMIN